MKSFYKPKVLHTTDYPTKKNPTKYKVLRCGEQENGEQHGEQDRRANRGRRKDRAVLLTGRGDITREDKIQATIIKGDNKKTEADRGGIDLTQNEPNKEQEGVPKLGCTT